MQSNKYSLLGDTNFFLAYSVLNYILKDWYSRQIMVKLGIRITTVILKVKLFLVHVKTFIWFSACYISSVVRFVTFQWSTYVDFHTHDWIMLTLTMWCLSPIIKVSFWEIPVFRFSQKQFVTIRKYMLLFQHLSYVPLDC